MTNEPEPKDYTLRLAFDLEQISTSLQFHVLYNGEPAIQTVGKAAGAYHFHEGDKVTIEIFASFDPTKYSPDVISIRDLTLVSASANGPLQPYLSPFASDSAGMMLRHWANQGPVPTPGPMRPASVTPSPEFVLFKRVPETGATDPSGDLDVKPHDGQWQISGFLSVEVAAMGGVPGFCRVFEFDPSVIVGTGREG